MSTRFPYPLKLERSGVRKAILEEPFVFQSVTVGRIFVPPGFETDYASVPRMFWAIYPPDGEYTEAAVVHDYLYWTQPCSRAQADKVFLEGMKELGVPWARRTLIYSAVRLGGWMAWANNQREQGYADER